MCWYDYVKKNVLPKLPFDIKIEESFFKDGDFGDLHRIEGDYKGLIFALECWTKGMIQIGILDDNLDCDYIVLDIAYTHDSNPNDVKQSLDKFIKIINSRI